MARYIKKIEAEAAIVCLFPDMPRIKFNGNQRRWREENEQYLQCLDAIHSIPTADVRENVKAHWLKEEHFGGIFKCSNCGKYIDFKGLKGTQDPTNFCPYCGAVMDERGEE